MKITIIGASGFLGTKLCAFLSQKNISITVLGRSTSKKFRQENNLDCQYYQWANQELELPPKESLEGCDVLIHLGGENIGSSRWTKRKKEKIYNSRVLTSKKLVERIHQLHAKPCHIICASATGIYGDTQEHEVDETSPLGSDFLAHVCRDWEQAWQSLYKHSMVSHLRTGVVWSRHSGFLKEMESIYNKFLGGRIGDGEQFIPWIHLNDYIEAIYHIIINTIEGPVNIVAPQTLKQMDFNHLFSKTLHKPAIVHAPTKIIKLALGEMSCLALNGQKVAPRKLSENGFTFLYPTALSAMENLYSTDK